MKQNKNILRAALWLLLVIAAPEVRAQQLITDNGDGTYTITMPDHNVTVTADVKKLLTHKDIKVSIPSQEWTGSELTPVITVTDGETELTLNTDYTVTPPSGTIKDAGDYTYTITGMGSYTGETTATFTITASISVEYTITDVSGTDAHGTIGFYSDEDCSTAISAAEEGATVYIKSTPNTGYKLNSITTQKTVPSDAAESRRNTPATVEIALGGEVAVTAVDAANGIYKLTMPSSNVTVEATFTPITYSIEYELVGGTVATANPTEYTVESTPITLNNPTLEGYTFGGWTGSNGNTPQKEVTIATSTTGNLSYKAVWYTEAAVRVEWNDKDNHDQLRPASLVATLSDGQKVTLNNGNSWTATVEDLPAFDADNQVIAYTWTASTVDGYELEIELGDAVTTLTYSHTPTHDFTFATGQTWMTWCGSEEYALPSGLEAYTVSGLSEDGTKVVLAQQESILADTPLLLKGTAGTTYSATYSSTGSATGLASTPIENVLTFYGNPTEAVITTGYNYEFGKTYVLYKGAFVLVDSDQGLPAHRCMLTLSSAVTARLGISIEGTTSLTPIPISTGEGSWYDLQGRKLSGEPTKHGIYIFKGKKVKR